MQYKLLEHNTIPGIENLVNEHLADGWKLHGSPFPKVHNVCQAVTRNTPARPKNDRPKT